MTPIQQAAMEVVDRAAKGATGAAALERAHALALIDMLASPVVTDELRGVVVMPEEPSEDTIDDTHLATFFSKRYARKAYRAIYASLRDRAIAASRKRTEWVISGRATPGGVVVFYAVARTEAERDDHVAAALKNGCHPVTIDRREVAG
jgi:hypothetical protein